MNDMDVTQTHTATVQLSAEEISDWVKNWLDDSEGFHFNEAEGDTYTVNDDGSVIIEYNWEDN